MSNGRGLKPISKGAAAFTQPLAVIYCRVSSKEQVDNYSLETQQKACRAYCEREGLVIDRTFIEEGESAKTINRTEFKKMLEYCAEHKGRIQWIVVYNVSRFSRNTLDHLTVRATLYKLGIGLRSATEQLDDSPMGKCMENMLAVFSQLDNDAKAARTVAGMQTAISKGRWPFKPPLGYIRGSREGPSLLPDPLKADQIKQAFEMFATGRYSKQKILQKITALGLKTSKGKKLSKQTFFQTLKKAVYAGWIEVGQWQVRQRGDFEPLISQETFDAVQSILSGKKKALIPHLRNHPDFPLRSFITCGCCARPLTASWSKGRNKKYPYYRCQKSSCKGVNIRKDQLESAFLEKLQQLQPKSEYLKLFRAVVLDVWNQRQSESILQTSQLRSHLEDLKQKQERLEEVYIYEKSIDRAVYERQRDKLTVDIAAAEMELRDAELAQCNVELVLSFAEHVLSNAGRLWSEANLDQKQRFQRVLFPQGLPFSNGIFGTAETSLIFNLLQPPAAEKSSLVTPTGFEPVPPP